MAMSSMEQQIRNATVRARAQADQLKSYLRESPAFDVVQCLAHEGLDATRERYGDEIAEHYARACAILVAGELMQTRHALQREQTGREPLT